jgi:hypothetical protein
MKTNALALLLFSGCGGSLNEDFAGTWLGTYSATLAGVGSSSSQGSLVLTVEGGELTDPNGCGNGGGPVVMTGEGDAARWEGAHVCPPISGPYCSSIVITMQAMDAALASEGKRLLVHASGTANGCGDTLSFVQSFDGRK